jgi:MFS family permease
MTTTVDDPTGATPAGDPPPPVSTAPDKAWHLLRERMFRRYWSAAAVSFVGDQISLLALPLLAVLVLDATPADMGYLTAAGLAPNLLIPVFAGAWVDRRRYRRYVMIGADIGRALLIASIPVAFALGMLDMPHLYVVAFLIGTCGTFFEVANSTLFVSVVRPDQYIAASSMLNGSRAMAFVAGPSIGGWLVQGLTAPIALLADAVSYVVSAVFLGRVKVKEPDPETSREGQLTAGVRFLVKSHALWSLIMSAVTINLFNYMFSALFVLYVTVHLGVTPGILGIVIGGASAGALLGSLVTGRLVRAIGVGPAFIVGLVAFPAPLILVPLAAGPTPTVLGLLFIAEFGSGLGVMILDITAGSLLASLVPNRLRARVSGAHRTVNYGIRPIGALLGGALGTALGVRPTLWIATVGALLGLLWMIGSPLVRMRTLPEPPP